MAIRNSLSTVAALAVLAAMATPSAQAANPLGERVALGLGVGSEGVAGTLTAAILPGRLNLNVGVNGFSHRFNFTSDNVRFRAALTLGGEPVTLSYFPFHGYGFNLQAGLFFNRNAATVTGTPNYGGVYTINGTVYTASAVGSLTGKTHFNSVAPYLGVGWGNPVFGSENWTFVANAGAVYEGNPNVRLTATGGAANPQLASDVQAEQNSVNSKLNFLNWWPVIDLGLSYRF